MHRIAKCLIVGALVLNCCGIAGDGRAPDLQGGVHLAPPLVLDDIGDGSPALKHIALAKRAEIFLQMELEYLDETGRISRAEGARAMRDAFMESQRLKEPQAFTQESLFNPSLPKAFFNQVDHVGGHIYAVPLSVPMTANGRESTVRYTLLFSNLRNGDRIFPTVVCPDEQVAKYRDEIAARGRLGILPMLAARDRAAIGRYLEHDSAGRDGAPAVDAWIRGKMEAGEYAVNAAFFTDRYEKAQFLYHPYEQRDLVAQCVARAHEAGISDAACRELEREMDRKPLVLIYRKPGEPLPVVTMAGGDGRPVPAAVRAHTSDNAVYIILEQELFETMLGGAKPGATKSLKKPMASVPRGSDACRAAITDTLFYEAGVHLGLSGSVNAEGRPVSALTEAYAAARADPSRYTPPSSLADLRTVRLSDSLTVRDYAAGDAEAMAAWSIALTANLDESVVAKLLPVIQPDQPVTLQEMVHILRTKTHRIVPRRLSAQMVIRAGQEEIAYTTEALRVIKAILRYRGLLLDQGPVPAVDEEAGGGVEPMVLMVDLEDVIRGRVLTREERFDRIFKECQTQSPARAALLGALRIFIRATPAKIEEEIGKATSSGMDRRILRMAFFMESGDDRRYEVTLQEAAADDVSRPVVYDIDEAWQEGGLGSGIDPFGSQAQACYSRILALSDGLPVADERLSPETWYKICIARLFGRMDARSVIAFFEVAQGARASGSRFFSEVLHHRDLSALAILARMMDRESVTVLEGSFREYYRAYLERLFGSDLAAVVLRYGADYPELLIRDAQEGFTQIVDHCRASGDYERALELVDTFLAHFQHEGAALQGQAGLMAAGFEDALQWRSNIMLERDMRRLAGITPDALSELNAAWREADVWMEAPFCAQAQACCARMLPLARGVTGFTTRIEPAAWYRICYAKLYGAFDYRFILRFFDFVIATRDTDEAFFSAVTDNREFVVMYMTARLMDHDGIRALEGRQTSVFAAHLQTLYGKMLINAIGGEDGRRFLGEVVVRSVKRIYRMMRLLTERRDYDGALRLIDDALLIMEHERGLPGAFDNRFSEDVDLALRLRSEVTRLREMAGKTEERDAAAAKDPLEIFDRDERMDALKWAEVLRDSGVAAPPVAGRGIVQVFSRKITFEYGFGYFLKKLARSGMRIAVVAKTERERELIRELNQDIQDEDLRIVIGTSLGEIEGQLKAQRYYYYMGEDEDPVDSRYNPILLSHAVVLQIIRNLGAAAGLPVADLGVLKEAAEQFANSA